MKHQKFIFKLVLLFFVIFNVKSAISQEEGLLNKTKSQIKLTETKQLYLQGNIKTALLNYKEIIALNPQVQKLILGFLDVITNYMTTKRQNTMQKLQKRTIQK